MVSPSGVVYVMGEKEMRKTAHLGGGGLRNDKGGRVLNASG